MNLVDRLKQDLPIKAIFQGDQEPTTEDVDRAVQQGVAKGCDYIVALGGGSVVDCGKACAIIRLHSLISNWRPF